MESTNILTSFTDADTADKKSERRVWLLLPLLVLMLAAGLVAIYYIPTNLDMVPLIQIWCFLTAALSIYAAIRINTSLASPTYTSIENKPDGAPVIWNTKTYLRMPAILAAIATTLAALNLFFSFGATSYYNIEYLTRDAFKLLSVALLSTFILGLLWFLRSKSLQNILDSRWGNRITVTLIAIACWWVYSTSPEILNPTPYTSFASWSTIKNFARHEVDKIDKDAELHWAFVDVPFWLDGPYQLQTTPFQMSLIWLRPNGDRIKIDLLDSEPPRIVSFDSLWDSGSWGSDEYLRQLAKKTAYVTLGPRDVYNFTEQEGMAFARKRGIKVRPHLAMFFDHEWKDSFGVLTGWNMEYAADFDDVATKKKMQEEKGDWPAFHLRVDGATGRILEREDDVAGIYGTPTPQPSTTPTINSTPTTTP